MTIELKRPVPEDREALKAMCNAVDRQFLSERMPDPYTDEAAEWWLGMTAENEGKTGIWRLIWVDGEAAGNISVERKADVYRKDGEIGYMLRTEYWSKGIMTEAVRQICEMAFEELGLVRITGLVYAPNGASCRVLEKNGFEREGLQRRAVYKNGQMYDLCLFGKLR